MRLSRFRRFACALFRPREQDAQRLVHRPDIRVHRLRVRHADADGKARIRKHREIVDAVAHRRHLLRRDARRWELAVFRLLAAVIVLILIGAVAMFSGKITNILGKKDGLPAEMVDTGGSGMVI